MATWTATFTAAVLDEAGKVATEVLLPLNEVGDRQGCSLENGRGAHGRRGSTRPSRR